MLQHLTGAQGYIKVGGVVWADASFDYTLTRAAAKASRNGKQSDLNLPGKLSVKITAKNIMRSSAKLGGQISAAAITGTGGTIKSGVTVTADGFTAASSPTIATPSIVSATVATAAMTTAGTITIIGRDANSNEIEEAVAVGLIGIGAKVYSTKLFSYVEGVYVTAIRSTGGGTLTIASEEAAASSYTVSYPPALYNLEFGGLDTVTSNYVKVFANNCWTSSSKLASADANTVFMDDIAFEMEDIDADLSITDVTTN